MWENDTDTLTIGTLAPFWQWEGWTCNKEVKTGISMDSVLQHRELPIVAERTSMFCGHLLPVEHPTVVSRPQQGLPVWIFAVLLSLTALLCLFCSLRKIEILRLPLTLVNGRSMRRFLRNYGFSREYKELPIGLLAVAVFCLPAYTLVYGGDNVIHYVMIVLSVSLLYFLKNAMLRFLGNVFEQRHEMSLCIASNYVFHLMESVVVVALLYPCYYLPDSLGGQLSLLWVVGGIVAVMFVLRLYREMNILLNHPNLSCFYLFYYLCIVECIPLLVAIKLFITYFSVS